MRTALASEVERRAREGLPKLPLLNSHHNAPMTAEMAVALLLACAKRLLPADAALRRGDWSARGSAAGRPGPAAAASAAARARRPARRRRRPRRRRQARRCGVRRARYEGARHLAGGAHPRGRAQRRPGARPRHGTRRVLFGARRPGGGRAHALRAGHAGDARHGRRRELAALPDDAVVVNVGRGSLVQPAPLKAALEAGALAGYGSDVWWSYPKAFAEVTPTPPWADDATSLAALRARPCSAAPRRRIGLEAVEQARWQARARTERGGGVGPRRGAAVPPAREFSLNKGY